MAPMIPTIKEQPEERIIENPRSKLRRRAFEAGLEATETWWPELAPLNKAERAVVILAVREANGISHSERDKFPAKTVEEYDAWLKSREAKGLDSAR